MTDKKFREKLQDMEAYEDSVYSEFLELIKPYNQELEKQGCEIFCCLMWCYIDNKSNIRVERERPIFDKKESCSCDIVLQFQHIGEDYYESEIGIGFQICHTITSYGLNFFMGWKFFNYKTEKLKKHLKQAFLEVQNMGLEKVSKLYES
jgi:hypothetical protein